MDKKGNLASKVFIIINITFLVLIGLLCVLPIWYTLSVSLSSKAAAAAGMVKLWPVGFTTLSYRQIINDTFFFNAFFVSVKRVVLGVAVSFFVMVLMAYPLSKTKKEFKGRDTFMWLLVFTMLFNGGMVPLYIIVKEYNLINSIWALVLGGSVPMFNVILIVNFFRNIPKELEEAAIVDGAGPWYTLFKLIVPISVPVLSTVTLFTFVYHWNEFFYGLIFMTKQENYPLQTYIQQLVVVLDFTSMNEDQYKVLNELSNETLNAAKLFIALIPILMIYPFLQRYFITGITLGSVKG